MENEDKGLEMGKEHEEEPKESVCGAGERIATGKVLSQKQTKQPGVYSAPGNLGHAKLKCIPLLGVREGMGEQIVLLQKHWICPSFDLRWTE